MNLKNGSNISMGPSVIQGSELPAVASLSDAMGQLGLKFQTMHSGLRPVFEGARLSGPAYTVQCYAGATYAVEEAIECALPGDVLVIAGEGYTGAVLMGELLSARACKRGVAGAVIDGAVRDTAKLKSAGWPIFAAGITPRAGTFDRLGAQQIPVNCAGVVVQPGDMIVGDDDGIVVLPQDSRSAIVELAHSIEVKEAFLARAIADGVSLTEAVEEYRKLQSGETA